MSEALEDRGPTLPGLLTFDGEAGSAGTATMRIPARRTYAESLRVTVRDRALLRWIGEQYTVRADLLAVLMARFSRDPEAIARGRIAERTANRRIQGWRDAGLVKTRIFDHETPATVWLTGDGYAVAGLPWRTYEPSKVTTNHRHAVGLVRADAETMAGVRWVCERDLREGLAGRPLHLPDGVVESVDATGRTWRTAVEVEISRKTEARVGGILRELLATYDDVVYHAVRDAGAVVVRAAAGVDGAAERVHVRPYPPPLLADIA